MCMLVPPRMHTTTFVPGVFDKTATTWIVQCLIRMLLFPLHQYFSQLLPSSRWSCGCFNCSWRWYCTSAQWWRWKACLTSWCRWLCWCCCQSKSQRQRSSDSVGEKVGQAMEEWLFCMGAWTVFISSMVNASVAFAFSWIMPCKKCLKTQKVSLDCSDDNFKEGVSGNGAGSGNEDDNDNCVEFAADGGIIANEMACVVNHAFGNLSKLQCSEGCSCVANRH